MTFGRTCLIIYTGYKIYNVAKYRHIQEGLSRAVSIDRNSPVPAYYQIQLDLSDRIQRGEWNDRKQLPSESTLAEQYAVSRITLRQALAELEKDGIIKKSRGCGAKICEKPAPFVHKMDFYSIVATHEGHDGKQVTSQVLNIRRFDMPTEDVIEHLQLEPGTPVVYIKRLFLFDDKPLAVGRSWLSLARFPGLDETGLGEKGLTATLRSRYNTIIAASTTRLRRFAPRRTSATCSTSPTTARS